VESDREMFHYEINRRKFLVLKTHQEEASKSEWLITQLECQYSNGVPEEMCKLKG
jgi:hypothetical protein